MDPTVLCSSDNKVFQIGCICVRGEQKLNRPDTASVTQSESNIWAENSTRNVWLNVNKQTDVEDSGWDGFQCDGEFSRCGQKSSSI